MRLVGKVESYKITIYLPKELGIKLSEEAMKRFVKPTTYAAMIICENLSKRTKR